MKKLLKIIGILVLVIVILVGIAIAMVATMLDQTAIKNKITQTVQQKTGRQLIFQGHVAWSFFPWVGIKVTDVKLTNNKIFKNTEFAHIGELDVRVRLIPLLSKKIEVDKFVLKNADLTLIKNRAGYTDWQDLTQVVNLNTASTSSNSALELLTIGNIEIQNGHVLWQNQQSAQKVEISKLNFSGTDINFSDPFAIQGSFAFHNFTPNVSGELQLQAKITLNFKERKYLLRDFAVNGKLSNGAFVAPLDLTVNGDITADLNKEVLDATSLRIQLANMVAIGGAKCIALLSAPKVNANVTIVNSDATGLLQLFGLSPTTDAWKNVVFKADLETTSKFVKFPRINAQIGDMQVKGSGSYSHFDDKIVAFNLDVNKFDAASFVLKSTAPVVVPVKRVGKKSVALKTAGNGKANDSLFLEIIRAIKVIGDLHVGTMQLNKIALSNVNLEIDGNHGLLAGKPFSANFYRGKINGSASIDLRNATPVITVKSSISGISLQQMLNDFAAFDKVTGVAAIDSNISMRGVTGDALFRSLSGNGKLLITQGIYHGMDLAYQVRKAHAMINQKPMPQESQPPQTNFGKVTANFALNNAVMSTNDLAIQSADINAKGHGTANLVSQAINFQLTAYSPNDRNFYVPLNITNTFANPVVRPDLGAIAQHVVAGAVQQQIQKQLDKQIKNKDLQEKIMKALPLDKLFKN